MQVLLPKETWTIYRYVVRADYHYKETLIWAETKNINNENNTDSSSTTPTLTQDEKKTNKNNKQ